MHTRINRYVRGLNQAAINAVNSRNLDDDLFDEMEELGVSRMPRVTKSQKPQPKRDNDRYENKRVWS